MDLGTIKINNDEFVIQLFGSEYCIYRVGYNFTFSFQEVETFRQYKKEVKQEIYGPIFKKELSKHLNNYILAISRFDKLKVFT